MKKLTTLFLISAFALSSTAQVFWSEDFGTGCNTGTNAGGSVTTNGTWIVTDVAPPETYANEWFISAHTRNTGVGNCAADCAGGTNMTEVTLQAFTAASDTAAQLIKELNLQSSIAQVNQASLFHAFIMKAATSQPVVPTEIAPSGCTTDLPGQKLIHLTRQTTLAVDLQFMAYGIITRSRFLHLLTTTRM